MKRGLLLVLIVGLSWVSAHAQGDINAVVKAVEARYALHHHGVPGLWIAKPFMLGSGVGGLKMAVFDNFSRESGDAAFKQVVDQALGPEWSPFISVTSHDERTLMYSRPNGSKLMLLIATCDRDGLTLMQMKVGGKALHDWVDEPVETATSHRRNKPAATHHGNPEAAAFVSEP